MPMALNADFFQEVTIFQPMRPSVIWSRVENRFARTNGDSKDVDTVIPNVRFLVTVAIAVMGYSSSATLGKKMPALRTIAGSVTGH